MKKVLIINTSYRNYGGEDSNIVDEVNLLKNIYDVRYLEYKNSEKIKFREFLSFFTNKNQISNKTLIECIKNFQPDIAYIHNTWFRANLDIFRILRNYEIPVLHKIHNFRYFCTKSPFAKDHFITGGICHMCGMNKKTKRLFNKYYEDSFSKSLFASIYGKRYFKILLGYPMKILIMNDFHKKFLRNQGINEKKLEIYYNPIEITTKGYKYYDSNSKNVVYAGRLTESKGLINLIETWIAAETKDLNLVIIGSGDLENYLKKTYVNENIKFYGEKSNEETKKFIKESRAVITCTKLLEGQPKVLSEASSFGIPSIFPSFGGMEEYFPYKYELSFEQFNYENLKEKIEKLNDKDLMEKLSLKVFNTSFDMLNPQKLLNDFNSIVSEYE